MANLKLVIVPAKILVSGKHKVRVALSHARATRYIPTSCIINDLSEFKDGQIINRSDAPAMNVKLRNALNHYQKIIDEIHDPQMYSCSELLTILVKRKDRTSSLISDVLNEYLSELKEEKRLKSEKLYRLAVQSFIKLRGDMPLLALSPREVKLYKIELEEKGLSPTTIRIYLTLFKVLINYAKKHRMVTYEIDPFEFLTMPSANIREIDLTVKEIKAIRDLEAPKYNIKVVRDIFMLSYYLGGINLVDMLEIDFRKTYIEYTRSKTKNKKSGETKTSFTIQPEARDIINRYMKKNDKLVLHIDYLTLGRLRELRTLHG